jgi:hypothetical protein
MGIMGLLVAEWLVRRRVVPLMNVDVDGPLTHRWINAPDAQMISGA